MKEIDQFLNQISLLTDKISNSFGTFSFGIEGYVQSIEPNMDTIQNLKTISTNIQSTLAVFTNATTILTKITVDELMLVESEPSDDNFVLYLYCLSNIIEELCRSSATGMSSIFPAIHTRIKHAYQTGIDKLYDKFEQILHHSQPTVSLFSEEQIDQLTKFVCFLVNSENATGIDENKLASIYIKERQRICAEETYPVSCCILECTKVPYVRNSHPLLLLLQRVQEIIQIETTNVEMLFEFLQNKDIRIKGDLIGSKEIVNRIIDPLIEEMRKLLRAIMEKVRGLFEPSLLYFDSLFITVDIESCIEINDEEQEGGSCTLELNQHLISIGREYAAFNASVFNLFENELEKQLTDQSLAIPNDASTHLIVCKALHFCNHLLSYSKLSDRLVLIGKGGKYSNCIDYACNLLVSIINKLQSITGSDKVFTKLSFDIPIERKYFELFFLYNNYYYSSLRLASTHCQEECDRLKEEIVALFECSNQSNTNYLSIIGIIRQLDILDNELKKELKQLLLQTFLPQYMTFITSSTNDTINLKSISTGKKEDSKKQSITKYPTYSEVELAVQHAFEQFAF